MTVSLATITKNAEADATGRLMDAGLFKIYSGSVPANANASLGSAVLLATLTASGTSAPAASGGVLTFNAIASDTSADGGANPAAFFRGTKADGSAVMQGSVSEVDGGGDMEISSLTIVAGETVSCSSCTYTRN